MCAGVGALLITKEHRFEHVFGDGGAIHRDKWLVNPCRVAVQILGQHFFSAAGLAGYQNTRVVRRDLLRKRIDLCRLRVCHNHIARPRVAERLHARHHIKQYFGLKWLQ